VFDPLNGEDDEERDDGGDRRPYSEVTEPDIWIVDYLDGELYANIGDDGDKESLQS
jgi:hypothetical protein